MPTFDVIDAHVHTYPSPEIGLRAKANAGDGNNLRGTIEDLSIGMTEGPISTSVVLSIHPYWDMRRAAMAKIPANLDDSLKSKAKTEIEELLLARQQRRNQWTCETSVSNSSLVPFITVDPSMPEQAICSEIETCVKNQGARGIKLHCSMNRFFPYDPRLRAAYELVQNYNLPIVFHGGNFSQGTSKFSRPKEFKRLADQFPRLNFTLAHLGSTYFTETKEIASLFPKVNFDCSAVISGVGQAAGLSSNEIVHLIRAIGIHRVHFGSDYPFFNPVTALANLLKLPLTTDEKRLILADNARRSLGIN